MQLIPTILCGGAVSWLLPIFRELHSKPFIHLNDGQSLLQKAFLRGVLLPGEEEILAATNRELFFKTENECRGVNAVGVVTSIILKSFGRNAASAIAVVAIQIAKKYDNDVIMLVAVADYLIADQQAFQQAVLKAVELTASDKLVVFGIDVYPETGNGYIKADCSTVIMRLVEKPSLEKAQEYITSGRFLWNSGMFCFSVGVMLQQVGQYCPQIHMVTKAHAGQSRSAENTGFALLESESGTFANNPDDSSDYAVMEKLNQVAVVPCNIGWSDIGAWMVLGDLVEPYVNGSRIQGNDGLVGMYAVLEEDSGFKVRGNKVQRRQVRRKLNLKMRRSLSAVSGTSKVINSEEGYSSTLPIQIYSCGSQSVAI